MLTSDLTQMILARGRPIELLCDVARDVKVRVGPQAGLGPAVYVYPSLSERLFAARTLAGKVLADMRANEISGPGGEPPLSFTINFVGPAGGREN